MNIPSAWRLVFPQVDSQGNTTAATATLGEPTYLDSLNKTHAVGTSFPFMTVDHAAVLSSLSADEQASLITAATTWPIPAVTNKYRQHEVIGELFARMTVLAQMTTVAEHDRYEMCRDLWLWTHNNSGVSFASALDIGGMSIAHLIRNFVDAWADPSYAQALLAGAPLPRVLKLEAAMRALMRSGTVGQAENVLAMWPTPPVGAGAEGRPHMPDPRLPVVLLAALTAQAFTSTYPGEGIALAVKLWATNGHDTHQALQGIASVAVQDSDDDAVVSFVQAVLATDDQAARSIIRSLPEDINTTVVDALVHALALSNILALPNAACEAMAFMARQAPNATGIRRALDYPPAIRQNERFIVMSADTAAVESLLDALVQWWHATTPEPGTAKGAAYLMSLCSRRLGWKVVDVPLDFLHYSNYPDPDALRASGRLGVDAIAAFVTMTTVKPHDRRPFLKDLRAVLDDNPTSALDIDDDAWPGIGRLTTDLPVPAITTLATHGGPKGKRFANRALAAALA